MNDNKPRGGVGEGISYPRIQRVTVVLQNLAKNFNVLYETVHALTGLMCLCKFECMLSLNYLQNMNVIATPFGCTPSRYSKSLLPVARVL